MNAKQLFILVLVASLLAASCDALRRRGGLGGLAAGIGLGLLGAGLLGGFHRPYYGGYSYPLGGHGYGGYPFGGLGYGFGGYPIGPGYGGLWGYSRPHIHLYWTKVGDPWTLSMGQYIYAIFTVIWMTNCDGTIPAHCACIFQGGSQAPGHVDERILYFDRAFVI